MRPDEAQHLAQLQRSAAELGRLAQDLAASTPPSIEGSDPTYWVHVILGPDGIPTENRVREGWQQRVAPARLASAVMDANLDAVQRTTPDRKSTRLNSSHTSVSRMPSSA